MIAIGRLNKYIDLQRPTQTVTPEGSAQDWTTYAAGVKAAIDSATPALIERLVGATVVTAPLSHLVTIWHRERRATPQTDPGPQGMISPADRVLFRGRALQIVSISNPREDDRVLLLACEERTA